MVGAKASEFFYSQDTNLLQMRALTLIKLRAKVCAGKLFLRFAKPICGGKCAVVAFLQPPFCRLLKDSILLPQWLSLHGFNSIYRSARRTAPPKPQSFCASL
jgi:hypothetical protein